MNQKQIAKQMIDFYQTSFTNAYNANVLIQDQFERVTKSVMDQTPWLPPEGREAIDKWVQSYKAGRDNFKKHMEDSYKEMESIFAG